jgi:hypothetical protein
VFALELDGVKGKSEDQSARRKIYCFVREGYNLVGPAWYNVKPIVLQKMCGDAVASQYGKS